MDGETSRPRQNEWRVGGKCWQGAGVAQTMFDERIAARYETYWPELFEPAAIDPVISFLAGPGDGRVLELGVGTGRLALPLARRGVPVHGIELSEPMVARRRAQPGADRGSVVTIGDIATTTVGGTFRLAFLRGDPITNLTSQDEQVQCFRTVAAQLEPGGCLVIENYIPALQRLPPGE